ncbi:MAG: alpha/beta fold hydrolase [Acidimicrobiales bacterium]
MRKTNAALGVVATAAATTIVVTVIERRVLALLDSTGSPAHWKPPRFPYGDDVTIPVDDGAEIRARQCGDPNDPTVVLVHGLTSSINDWGLVADDLVSRGYCVVGINQRGHGGSTIGDSGFTPTRLGTDLGQVLRAMDLRNVTLVGHSMGGIASMSLMTLAAESGAERVGSLALVSTIAHTHRADRKAMLALGNTRPYERLAHQPTHASTIARFVFGEQPSREMVDAALSSNYSCPRETRVGAARGLQNYDIRDRIGDITVPTLAMCGDRDRVTPLRDNRQIAAAIGADLEVIPGTGHLVIWEAPNRIAEAIDELATRTNQTTNS